MTTRSGVSILVMGAGVTGLSTAWHLQQAGFSKVAILEASNRVGGRVMSVRPKAGGGVVELGATVVHGASMDNPIYNLASQWGMTKSMVQLDRLSGRYYQENGEPISQDVMEKMWELYLDLETKMEQLCTNRDTKSCPNPLSFDRYIQMAKPKIIHQFPVEKCVEATKAFNSLLNYCQFINGDELNRLSASLCGQYKGFPGPEMFFTNTGFSGFVERLQKEIPEEKLHLNSEVSSVSWSKDGVEVACKNGQTYKADHLIITCSLGYLKANHKELFTPPLPDFKTGPIDRIGFGRVSKLFLYFDKPFWTEGIKLAWDTFDQSIDRNENWVKSLLGFDTIPTNSNAIGNPFAGRGAEILETMSDEEVATTCRDLLRKFLKDPTIPKPSEVLRSKWNSDPLFKGGYSYLAVNSKKNDIVDLGTPLPDDSNPRLQFAGEATHPDYYSTVHGAYLSGVRESQRLSELYKHS